MLSALATAYREAILETSRERALSLVEDAWRAGTAPEELVFEVVVPTVDGLLSDDCTPGSLSLAQHFMTAQITGDVLDRLLPRFGRQPRQSGRVVIGTASGDFHGLGKMIVAGCLRARMIEVIDLGLNVGAERFVNEAEAQGCEVIAISSMMLHTARSEEAALGVRRLLRQRGLEGRMRLLVGGAPYRFDERLYLSVGADAWASSALQAGPLVSRLIGEVRQ